MRRLSALFLCLVSSSLTAATTISSFTPTSGVAGTVVTITGSGFSAVTSINFYNSVSATTFHVDSSTQITVTVPSGVTNGPITLFGLFGNTTSADSFTVPAPVITWVAPHQIVRDTVVYIDGANFTDTSSVTFDSILSPFNSFIASFNVLSDSRIVAITPQMPLYTNARISVTTIGGGKTSSIRTVFMIGGLIANPTFDDEVAGWNYDPNGLAVTWSSIDSTNSPTSGSALVVNSAGHYALTVGQCVTVTGGTRYALGGRVFIPTQAATGNAYLGIIWYSTSGCVNSFISSEFTTSYLIRLQGSWTTQPLNTIAPPNAVAAKVVLETFPDSATFQAYFDNLFFDIERPPVVTSFSPLLGVAGSTDVSIFGSDLYDVTSVRFNGVLSPAFMVITPNQLIARVPNGATTGPIELFGPAGSGLGGSFRVIQPPHITRVDPPAGQFNAFIRIDGSDIDVTTAVMFGGVPATFTISSDSAGAYIQTRVPESARSGSVTVQNPAGSTNFPFSVTARAADFSGDGQSEVLLQDQSTGNVALWYLDHSFHVQSGSIFGYPGAAYSVVTSGDFNGDGYADLMLQNRSNGSVVVWLMNGTTILSGQVIAYPGVDWEVVGSGDFNRDGKADVILRNRSNGFIAEWQMNGASIAGASLIGLLNTSWRVVGIDDVDGNGTSDIILQNGTTSDVLLWQMEGFTVRKSVLLGTPGVNWQAKTVADLDGDGWGDLVLQNSSTHDIAVWSLFNLAPVGRVIGNGGPWGVAGAADYDGDGIADILLYEPIGGGVAVWKLTSGGVNGAIIGVPGPTWVPIAK